MTSYILLESKNLDLKRNEFLKLEAQKKFETFRSPNSLFEMYSNLCLHETLKLIIISQIFIMPYFPLKIFRMQKKKIIFYNCM